MRSADSHQLSGVFADFQLRCHFEAVNRRIQVWRHSNWGSPPATACLKFHKTGNPMTNNFACLPIALLTIAFSLAMIGNTAADEPVAHAQPIPDSKALVEFLKRFDRLTERGFVKTLRPGSTGIGYTLETLLQIKENNSPRGDLLGMEIKAYRDGETRFDDQHKMNLFLKEPEWLDSKTSAERIRDYGYIDDNGRQAWYQSVTIKPNSTGLRLVVDREAGYVLFLRGSIAIGRWKFDVLQKRLTEKLSEAVFVAAQTRGTGADEEFHFRTVTYCAKPDVKALLKLIEAGDVILELRMHLKPTGGARNHGTAFRLKKHRLKDLFAQQVRCRPLAASGL